MRYFDWSENTVPVDLIDFLWSWLIVHVNSVDRDLVVWLESNPGVAKQG